MGNLSQKKKINALRLHVHLNTNVVKLVGWGNPVRCFGQNWVCALICQLKRSRTVKLRKFQTISHHRQIQMLQELVSSGTLFNHSDHFTHHTKQTLPYAHLFSPETIPSCLQAGTGCQEAQREHTVLTLCAGMEHVCRGDVTWSHTLRSQGLKWREPVLAGAE